MLFEAERALHQGYRAWFRGELKKAISLLEASRASSPGSIDPLYPLARALSESGDRDRALTVIGEAIANEPENPAGRLFRAIILLDHDELDGARADLEAIRPPNPLATALGALLTLGECGTEAAATGPVGIAPAARWIADAAGRILAVLEVDLHTKHGGDAIDFHHKFFYPEGIEPAGPPGAGKRPGLWARAEAFLVRLLMLLPIYRSSATARERREALEAAFRSKDFQRVERLYGAHTAGKEWRDDETRLKRAFALLALGKDHGAFRFVEECLESKPNSYGFHFLEGVVHARAGRRREAGWSFTRAARLSDMDAEESIRDLAARITGRIVWDEEARGPRMPSHPVPPPVD